MPVIPVRLPHMVQKYGPACDAVSGAKVRGQFALERAYCLFKGNKLKEALSLCQGSDASAQLHALDGQVYSENAKAYCAEKSDHAV
jgi:hypothetical protein